MRLLPLTFKPGIVRDITEYGAKGSWYDCNLVRFRGGFPEKIGGWQKVTVSGGTAFQGRCRSLLSWSALDNSEYIGIGTHLKYYVELGGMYYDITPIRSSATLGTDPLTTASGSDLVTVAHTSHGANQNDFVTISGATGPINGVPADDINQEHQIYDVVDANSYRIQVDTSATGSGSGGGSSVDVEYQISVGLPSAFVGTGWSAGGWGEDGWGEGSDTTVVGAQLRLWGNDNFGEDLVFNVRNSEIYYWDKSGGTAARGVLLSSLSGAQGVPTKVVEVLVSDVDRHLIAFGATPYGSSVQDKMHIRWSDTEDAVDWVPTTENGAGDLQLSFGSEIVTAFQARQEILVWTDSALYSMRYVGAKFVFGAELIDSNISIMGPNAKVGTANMVFWMGIDSFYMYDGRVREIPCPVHDYVFFDFNLTQRYKVYAGINASESEVTWYYSSSGADENDRYVTYNYSEQVWYYGNLGRTAQVDRGTRSYPIAAANDGNLYYHEFGNDDGSTNPPSAINAYVESAPIELDEGYRFMFVRRCIPDVNFRNSSSPTAEVQVALKPRRFPGQAAGTTETEDVVISGSVSIYTPDLRMRTRTRALTFKISSSDTGVAWRLGVPRLEVRPDGRK